MADLDDFALTAESDLPVPAPSAGVRTSQTIGKLGAALAAAQGEMEGAAKDASNPHFRSKYATLASVREACGPLAKHGLAYLQPTRAEGARVTVTTLLLHSSGEWIAEDLTLTAAQNSPQALGSAITYGRKYGLAAMVGIAPTDDSTDDDGEAAEGRGSGPVGRVPMPPAPPLKPATPKPPGFQAWWDDLQAVADEGKDALELAWNKSAKDLRKYLTEQHRDEWAKVRAKALAVPS